MIFTLKAQTTFNIVPIKHSVGACAWSILVVELAMSHIADFRCALSGSAASQTVPSVILMYLSCCCYMSHCDDDYGESDGYCTVVMAVVVVVRNCLLWL